jgi:hypothetical protein
MNALKQRLDIQPAFPERFPARSLTSLCGNNGEQIGFEDLGGQGTLEPFEKDLAVAASGQRVERAIPAISSSERRFAPDALRGGSLF